MDISLPCLNTAIAGTFALLLVFIICQSTKQFKLVGYKAKSAPVAGGGWPVIGHLRLLGGTNLPHKTLGALADKYGPIFTIRVGTRPALVVSSSNIAKECFTTNDRSFASRPKLVASKHLGYNFAMFGLAPHSSYWRQMRKLATSELLSNQRLELVKNVWVSEIEASVKELKKLWSEKMDASSGHVLVDMKEWFENLSLNVIVRIIAGKRYDGDDGEARRWKKALKEFFRLLGMSVVSDVFPFLEWLDIGGHIKDMKATARELDAILEGWVEEHRRRKLLLGSKHDGGGGGGGGKQDFMDVMLWVLDGKDDLGGYDVDTVVKATSLAMISGGTDTTSVTLTWAISLLLNNLHSLKKVEEELNSHVGYERMVKESDITNLVYLDAIIKETMRLHPPTPLLPPRECIEDCVVAGNFVPKGTRLIVNVWKIQTDSRIWSDPLLFRPERFLGADKDIDVKGQDFELIPFGSGRRICPGTSFALHMLHLALASFLHAFEITNSSSAPVDMSETFGLTSSKATSLEILAKPRLPLELYL